MKPQINCNICDGIAFLIDKTFYKCKVCKTETWPDEDRLKQLAKEAADKKREEEKRQVVLWSLSQSAKTGKEPMPFIDTGYRNGGGNRSKGGKKQGNKPMVHKWESGAFN